MRIYILRVRYISSELEANEELKNPMAAAGAVKDALATGGVDKVTRWLLPSKTALPPHRRRRRQGRYSCYNLTLLWISNWIRTIHTWQSSSHKICGAGERGRQSTVTFSTKKTATIFFFAGSWHGQRGRGPSGQDADKGDWRVRRQSFWKLFLSQVLGSTQRINTEFKVTKRERI